MGRIFLLFLSGGLGGLAGWAVAEPFAPDIANSITWSRWEILFSVVTGAGIGLAIGAIGGWAQGSRSHFYRGAFGGLLLGAIGGYLGLQLGGFLATLFLRGNELETNTNFTSLVVARTLVFIPFGAVLGLVQGLPARSMPRALTGIIGGAIGGAIGGSLFDVIGNITAPAILAARGEISGEVGAFARGIAMTVMGSAIGLFVGVVENLTRRAWVRLELGRNEGKEWIVDAAQTFLGRSESAHIPLYGDPNISPMHACIYRRSGGYVLVDGGSPVGIGVNGIRVPESTLSHGDVINIGSYSLRFLTKNAQPISRPVATQPIVQTQPIPSTAVPHQPTLLILDGPLAGNRIALTSSTVEAGRESTQISLSHDPNASRRHAAFLVTQSGVVVQDLGSTNGTTVNGIRVQEMSLRAGDTIGIGSTHFRLE